jgi:hypothetical protein
LKNKLKSLQTENILKQNEILNLESEIERFKLEFSQLREDQKLQQQTINDQQVLIQEHQGQLAAKQEVQLSLVKVEEDGEEQQNETAAHNGLLDKFQADVSSLSFDQNLEFSTERLKILTHQTEILLNLNKHLDKDSLIYTDHSTIEDFKRKFPDKSTIEDLQTRNIQLKTYNQNIDSLVKQTNNLIEVFC